MTNISTTHQILNFKETHVQETEKQLWEIIRTVPALNVAYGTMRCIVYVIKKDEKESLSSAVDAAKGVIQTAAITAGLFAAPVTIPVGLGVLTGVAAKSVSETFEVLIFFATNAEQFQGKSAEEKEKALYDKVKHITGVGALYSAARVPIYLIKKNKQQSLESGVSFIANSGDTAVQLTAGMIPNIDAQLQKVIERTARHAIKFLARRVMEQVSKQSVPLEAEIGAITEVENNYDVIVEVTSSSSSGVQLPLPSPNLSEDQNEKNIAETGSVGKWRKLLCCGCNAKETHDKALNSKGENESFQIKAKSTGHLIILTE